MKSIKEMFVAVVAATCLTFGVVSPSLADSCPSYSQYSNNEYTQGILNMINGECGSMGANPSCWGTTINYAIGLVTGEIESIENYFNAYDPYGNNQPYGWSNAWDLAQLQYQLNVLHYTRSLLYLMLNDINNNISCA